MNPNTALERESSGNIALAAAAIAANIITQTATATSGREPETDPY